MITGRRSRNSQQKNVLKNRLVSKKGSRCAICNKSLPVSNLTLDHIIPLAKNGTWNIGNLQLACYECNQEKADNYIDPWISISRKSI